MATDYILARKYAEKNTVYPADLTGQADGDYIRNDAGIWKPKDPSRVAEDVIMADRWQQIYGEALTVRITANGGSVFDPFKNMHIRLRAVAQAGSAAFASTFGYNAWNMGVNYAVIDFSKRIVWKIRASTGGSKPILAGNIKRLAFGGYHADGTEYASDPAYKMIGFKIISAEDPEDPRNMIIQGAAHNGSSFYTTNLETTVWGSRLKELTVVSNGDGTVNYYIDDVLLGTINTGPTGVTLPYYNTISAYSYNHDDTTNYHDLELFNNRIYIHQ